MEPSSTLYEGLLDPMHSQQAQASTRRWKIAAAISGAAVVLTGLGAASLFSERAALQAKLLEQEARLSPSPAAAVRAAAARPATVALAKAAPATTILATDTCTKAGTDIYGPPAPERIAPAHRAIR